MPGGQTERRAAQQKYATHSVGKYRTRIAVAPPAPQGRLQISPTPKGFARKAGLGFSGTKGSHLRAWMLLAPTPPVH